MSEQRIQESLPRMRVPTKKAAIRQVALTLNEATGVDESHLTPAERKRLEWALMEVQQRLLKMAGANGDGADGEE